MTPQLAAITILAILCTWSSSAQAEEPKADAPAADAPAADAPAAEAPAAEAPAAEAPAAADAPAADAPAGDTPAGDAPAADAPAAEAPAAEPATWWSPEGRKAEAETLQEIFNQMPKPVRRKDGGKLVYPRSVPLVVDDIHTNTMVWGAKLQKDVHHLGISKVHTTSRGESIGRDTAGISYCPVACNRISDIFLHNYEITIQYDGPISDWAGKASDNNSGYKRRFGSTHKAKCSFPMMYPEAPKNTRLDPEKASEVTAAVVAEIKRYCAE
jgi:hypothetical protein